MVPRRVYESGTSINFFLYFAILNILCSSLTFTIEFLNSYDKSGVNDL